MPGASSSNECSNEPTLDRRAGANRRSGKDRRLGVGDRRRQPENEQGRRDEVIEESFPASDPPQSG
jgi:hypothetical protein